MAETPRKRRELSRDFEPDECFYFGDGAARVRDLVADKGDPDLDSKGPVPYLVWRLT